MAGISRCQESAASPDDQCSVVSLPGLEAALSQWWKKDPNHTRQLAVALFERATTSARLTSNGDTGQATACWTPSLNASRASITARGS